MLCACACLPFASRQAGGRQILFIHGWVLQCNLNFLSLPSVSFPPACSAYVPVWHCSFCRHQFDNFLLSFQHRRCCAGTYNCSNFTLLLSIIPWKLVHIVVSIL